MLSSCRCLCWRGSSARLSSAASRARHPAAQQACRAWSAAATSTNSSMARTRGAFILFEGVDRSGKSTQAKLLVEALQQQGVPAELWNFPDRQNTVTGHAINEYLQCAKELDDRAIHLMFSANRQEKRKQLLAALLSGTTLVVDRYAYSGVAYSAAKGRRDMGLDWCKAPDAGLPAPDLVVFMQVSQEVAAQRAGFGQERYEKQEFQGKVRAAFEALREPHWVVQDAAQPVEQIHKQVLHEALEVIKRCQEAEPVKQLWDRTPLLLEPEAAAAQGTAPGGAGAQQPLQERPPAQAR